MKIEENEIITLLSLLIATPSLSKEESKTADILYEFFSAYGVKCDRLDNNVWAKNLYFDQKKPCLLLNSHHDTVKPNAGFTIDPYHPELREGKIFGLGSNDAGGCLVSLIASFLHFYDQKDLPYNLIIAATAEEEISGKKGIANLVPQLPSIDFAIIGEPTQLQVATAEKGLMVLDCESKGIAGHAARDEGKNAIYTAVEDISWFQNYKFSEESPKLGPIKMNVTMITSGSQHNVVPDNCKFVVDVRTTDTYTNQETLEIIKSHIKSDVTPRSTRLNPSGIKDDHPVVVACKHLGLKSFGSPTLSDQALLSMPSIKIGPGDSARSHAADEYIYTKEITDGISTYITLLNQIKVLN